MVCEFKPRVQPRTLGVHGKDVAILKVVVSVGQNYIVIYFDYINTTAFMICIICRFVLLPNEIELVTLIKLTNRPRKFL